MITIKCKRCKSTINVNATMPAGAHVTNATCAKCNHCVAIVIARQAMAFDQAIASYPGISADISADADGFWARAQTINAKPPLIINIDTNLINGTRWWIPAPKPNWPGKALAWLQSNPGWHTAYAVAKGIDCHSLYDNRIDNMQLHAALLRLHRKGVVAFDAGKPHKFACVDVPG